MDGSTPQSKGTDVFAARARYYSPANIFKVERPPIPQHAFVAERDQALATARTDYAEEQQALAALR